MKMPVSEHTNGAATVRRCEKIGNKPRSFKRVARGYSLIAAPRLVFDFFTPSEGADSADQSPDRCPLAYARGSECLTSPFFGTRPNIVEHTVKSYRKEIAVNIPRRMAFLNITSQVQSALKESGIREGLALVNAMHITASVFINDDEPGLHEDYARWLEELAPFDPSPERYHHNRTGEENGDAHHKRQIMGREVVVAVTEGALDFGPWEQIFYGEFDGRRKKRILIKIIGE